VSEVQLLQSKTRVVLNALRNDNDVFGHMNNPVYGVLIDSIVNQYMIDECAYRVNKGDQAGIIANTYCDYFGSVSYPDVVECGLRIVKLGKASVMYEVGIFRKGEEDVKAVGGSTHVFVLQSDGTLGKPSKDGMPDNMRNGYVRLQKMAAKL
jgi:acyl-CoA thioester hydrolase